jgi:transposase
MKAQICRELDRLELLLEQIRALENEREEIIAEQSAAAHAPRAKMLLEIKGIGAEFASILSS